MGYFHIAVATVYHRRMIHNHWKEVREDYTNAETGKPVTKRQAWNYIKGLEKKGYRVVPPCDNIKSDGTCAGHKRIS